MSATPKSTIEGATGSLDTDMLAIGGVGLGIGVTIFALKRGWGLLRNFAR